MLDKKAWGEAVTDYLLPKDPNERSFVTKALTNAGWGALAGGLGVGGLSGLNEYFNKDEENLPDAKQRKLRRILASGGIGALLGGVIGGGGTWANLMLDKAAIGAKRPPVSNAETILNAANVVSRTGKQVGPLSIGGAGMAFGAGGSLASGALANHNYKKPIGDFRANMHKITSFNPGSPAIGVPGRRGHVPAVPPSGGIDTLLAEAQAAGLRGADLAKSSKARAALQDAIAKVYSAPGATVRAGDLEKLRNTFGEYSGINAPGAGRLDRFRNWLRNATGTGLNLEKAVLNKGPVKGTGFRRGAAATLIGGLISGLYNTASNTEVNVGGITTSDWLRAYQAAGRWPTTREQLAILKERIGSR